MSLVSLFLSTVVDSKILHVFSNLDAIFPSQAKNPKKPLDLVHNLEVIYIFFTKLKINAKFIIGEELSVTGPGKLLEFYLLLVIAYAKCAPILKMTGCIRNFEHRKCTKHALTGIFDHFTQ